MAMSPVAKAKSAIFFMAYIKENILSDMKWLEGLGMVGIGDEQLCTAHAAKLEDLEKWVKSKLTAGSVLGSLNESYWFWLHIYDREMGLLYTNVDELERVNADIIQRQINRSLGHAKQATDDQLFDQYKSVQKALLENVDFVLDTMVDKAKTHPYRRVLAKLRRVIDKARRLRQYDTANAMVTAAQMYIGGVEPPFVVVEDRLEDVLKTIAEAHAIITGTEVEDISMVKEVDARQFTDHMDI